ncbi:Rne/Rng family ribonuclease, partial [Cellulomonas fimi]
SAARPRRRRAQASAGSPEEISEAARRAEREQAEREQAEREQADRARAGGEQAGDAQGATAEQAESTGTESGRGSRRRGRRAGRSAASAAPEQDETATDVSGTEVVPEEDADLEGLLVAAGEQDDQADEQSDELDAEQVDEAGEGAGQRRRRRRGGRGRRNKTETSETDAEAGDADEDDTDAQDAEADTEDADAEDGGGSSRRRRRRRRGSRGESGEAERPRRASDEVTALRGSTRLEAKRQRRREGRDAGRRRQIISEAEFLARRESVERTMVVRERAGRTQIAVLEDGVLVEHYVSNQAQTSMVGNVYLGRVQNVLPSMEAAFVDVGKGRNAVLYAGEVNWDAAGLEGQPRRIEQALKSGDSVLVQVTKDPIGHKGARLTSQVTLAGRYLVFVPGGGMTGISRKLPDTERNRLKKILREVVPDSAGVIVRTAAEGASEEELRADVARLQGQWEAIEKKARTASAPALLQGEPDMAIRVVRDIFNDDFSALVVQGDEAWSTISSYIDELAPDLAQKVSKWTGTQDVFTVHRVDEQLAKGMDRKVWLPSGGSLVIDRTEAMTVVDVNTGKFTGSGGTLEETVTRNNLEAAEEIVRQLRLRDIGGIIVIDFIDMVLESNRDLVLRRLVECLGRDRTKHQVAEVTSLGLVQMTRKRVGQGLVEAFSETCEHCHGRGFIVHADPVEKNGRPEAGAPQAPVAEGESKRSRRKRGTAKEAAPAAQHPGVPVLPEAREAVKATLATIAAAAAHAHEHDHEHHEAAEAVASAPVTSEPVEVTAGDGDAGRSPEVDHAHAEPVLDVLAALAASGVAREETTEPAQDETPGALPQDVDEVADEPLALTPVSPDLFADTADDDADGAPADEDGDARS